MSQLQPPCILLPSMTFIVIDLKVWNMNIGGTLFIFEIILIRFFTWCAREHFLADLKIFSISWKLIKPFWKTKSTLFKKFSKARIHWQGFKTYLRPISSDHLLHHFNQISLKVKRTAGYKAVHGSLTQGYYNQNENDSVVFCHNDLKRENIMRIESSTFDEKCM